MSQLVGFWSYARDDDAHSDGQLSQLRAIVGKAMALQHGGEITLWQDVSAIPFGADWAATIERTIDQTSFFIPIVTPRFLKSENCHSEFLAFRRRMSELGRDDLLFPIVYVGVDHIDPTATAFGGDVALLNRHQFIDFRPLLYADPRSAEVRRWAGELATSILRVATSAVVSKPARPIPTATVETAPPKADPVPLPAPIAAGPPPAPPPPPPPEPVKEPEAPPPPVKEPTPDVESAPETSFSRPRRRLGWRRALVVLAGLLIVAIGVIAIMSNRQDGTEDVIAPVDPATIAFNGVYFAGDGLSGWIAGEAGTILSTTDGGQSWTQQSSGTSENLGSIRFTPDLQNGWVVGGAGDLLVTADGGHNWTVRKIADLLYVNGAFFLPGGQTGWVTGYSGMLQMTVDGGLTWAQQPAGVTGALWSVYFMKDGRVGWAVGEGGAIIATTDGGDSWAPQTSGSMLDLKAVRFLDDAKTGWAAGSGGTILATKDGGRTWSSQASQTDADLTDLAVSPDGRKLWAVGVGDIVVTKNGGRTWSKVNQGFNTLNAIFMEPDGTSGWAVGSERTIYVTKDGWQSWTLQSAPAN